MARSKKRLQRQRRPPRRLRRKSNVVGCRTRRESESSVLGILEDWGDGLSDAGEDISKTFEDWGDGLSETGEYISDGLSDAGEYIGEGLSSVVAPIQELFYTSEPKRQNASKKNAKKGHKKRTKKRKEEDIFVEEVEAAPAPVAAPAAEEPNNTLPEKVIKDKDAAAAASDSSSSSSSIMSSVASFLEPAAVFARRNKNVLEDTAKGALKNIQERGTRMKRPIENFLHDWKANREKRRRENKNFNNYKNNFWKEQKANAAETKRRNASHKVLSGIIGHGGGGTRKHRRRSRPRLL